MESVRNDARGKLDHLDAEAAAAETRAKRQLFGSPPGSSAAHATSGSPMKKKKKKNNNNQHHYRYRYCYCYYYCY